MKILKPIKFTRQNSIQKRKGRRKVRKKSIFNKFSKRQNFGKKKIEREKEIKRRKNFVPLVIFSILSWTVTFYIILFVDPAENGSVQLFFISIILSLIFTFSLFTAQKRRVILLTISTIFFLTLRYFGIGNIINVFLILGLVLTTEVYFSKK